MARATFVKKARKDVPGTDIKAGDSYYWWKFRYGPKRYSKTPPRRSQLTQSAFYSALYDLQDDVIAGAEAADSLTGTRDDVVSALEEMRDEAQDKLDNMPEALRDSSSSGEMLRERIDALESAIDEYGSLDLDDDPEADFDEEAIERLDTETEDEYHARVEEAKQEHIDNFWQGKLDEFQNVEIGV